MVYEHSDPMSKPFISGCHVASCKPSSNDSHNHRTVSSTTEKAKYRATSTVLTFLVLICLFCHLPTGHCAKDRRVSQNSVNVNVLTHSEFSSGEKQPNALPRPQPDSAQPSTPPKYQNPRDALEEDENRREVRPDRRPELTTRERPTTVRTRPQVQQRRRPDSVRDSAQVQQRRRPESGIDRSQVQQRQRPDSVIDRSQVQQRQRPDSVIDRSQVQQGQRPETVIDRSQVQQRQRPESGIDRSQVQQRQRPESVNDRSQVQQRQRPESVIDNSQVQQRQPIIKIKPLERTETRTRTPPETTTRLTRPEKQNHHDLVSGIDKTFQARRQQSFPNELLEKKELCPPESLVHYNVTFIPLWSSKRFPKMYPTYRPNAQWSKAIGRTHDYSYSMWRLDTFASPAVKSFAEEGYAVDFDTETQGESGIYDMFTMPAIYRGVGSSKGSIFVDGTHPLVSLMVKIVPSPDWFVGVSGLNLCSKGKWRKKAIVKLFPIDAGTDKGLTFTSPNWPSYPPEKICRITASSPDHDASSFYYPKITKLPRIGYVILHKTSESKTIFKRQKPYKVHLAGVSDQTYSVLMGKGKEIPTGSHKPTTLVQSDQRPGAQKPDTASVLSNEDPLSKLSPRLAIIDSDPGTPLDCLVNNWSLWSECSKTCGFGRRDRHRFVTQERQNDGLICPSLKEEELCGSMRNCKWSHFQPFRWQALQRPRSALSRRH